MVLMNVTAGMILSMFTQATQVTNGGDYVYNADIEEGRLTTLYAYRSVEATLEKQSMSTYRYDGQDRLKEKTTYRWDADNLKWVPVKQLSFAYSDMLVTVDYARWNGDKNSFDAPEKRAEYMGFADTLLGVRMYQLEGKEGKGHLIDSYVMMHSDFKNLLAAL
ncbi:MAG: DUF3836 domain-containing protein [Prevotella sp.]